MSLEELSPGDFECPVCTAEQFAPLTVLDASGREHQAKGLFRCKACGFCFADVSKYRKSKPGLPPER